MSGPAAAAREPALAFLLASQRADGHWEDFRHRYPFDDVEVVSDAWTTAWVGRALLAAGASAGAACAWLLERRRQHGWGFCDRTPPDADSTAIATLFLVEADAAPPDLARSLMPYFALAADGFRTYLPGDPGGMLAAGRSWSGVHPCVSPTAALALARLGALHPAVRAAVVARVLREQDGDGSWPSFWWTGRVYATWASVELLRAAGGHDHAVARAVEWALSARRPDGGWGDDLGSESCAFYTALGASLTGAGIDWLVERQLDDGSWQAAPALRDPRPDVHEPWNDPAGLLLPPMADSNRLFCTVAALHALARHGA